MYGLTTIKGLIKRGGLAAFAIALFLSLMAVPAPAHAQRVGGGTDFQFQADASVGLARGQTVRIRIAATNNQGRLLIGVNDGIYRAGASAHVKVFDGSTGALLQSRELTRPVAGVHTIDINRDDLREAGEPGTGRIQLWIEVLIIARPASPQRAAAPRMFILTPSLEVMNTYTGVTTVQGGVWRTTNFLTVD